MAKRRIVTTQVVSAGSACRYFSLMVPMPSAAVLRMRPSTLLVLSPLYEFSVRATTGLFRGWW